MVTPAPTAPGQTLKLRGGVPGSISAGVARLPGTERKVVLVHVEHARRRGALARSDSETIADAARRALTQRLPLVVLLASSGADVPEGVASLDGWGRAARALSECSGMVPVVMVAYDLAVSGLALLLGMADLVVMTPEAVAYVSGPAAVAELTGLRLDPGDLGGQQVHVRTTGVAAFTAADPEEALEVVATALDYLPDHADDEPAVWASADLGSTADAGAA